MSTRERALVAAVAVVGEHGIRALTHASVDRRAGLPKGSTSNWFRTRSALLAGVVASIAESERGDFGAADAATPVSSDELIVAFTGMVQSQTGASASRSRARYALFLEAASDRELLAPLLAQRRLYEEWVRSLLAQLGTDASDDAARTLMAGLDGLVLHRLTVDPDAPVSPVVARLVRAAVTG